MKVLEICASVGIQESAGVTRTLGLRNVRLYMAVYITAVAVLTLLHAVF